MTTIPHFGDDVIEAVPVDGRGWLVVRANRREEFIVDRSVVCLRTPTFRRRPSRFVIRDNGYREGSAHQRRLAEHRAHTLLWSLLDVRQRRQWTANQSCWVHTDLGSLRLGTLYQILHVAPHDPAHWNSLCVVSNNHGATPPADEWTTMLLTLRTKPTMFLGVANTNFRDIWNNQTAAHGSTRQRWNLTDWRNDAARCKNYTDRAMFDTAASICHERDGDSTAALLTAVSAAFAIELDADNDRPDQHFDLLAHAITKRALRWASLRYNTQLAGLCEYYCETAEQLTDYSCGERARSLAADIQNISRQQSRRTGGNKPFCNDSATLRLPQI